MITVDIKKGRRAKDGGLILGVCNIGGLWCVGGRNLNGSTGECK